MFRLHNLRISTSTVARILEKHSGAPSRRFTRLSTDSICWAHHQQTDLQEFYPTVDLRDPELDDKLSQWQFHYNFFRPHSSLGGKTPIDFASEHSASAPFWDQVEALYDETKERIREQAYWRDLRMAKLARKNKTRKWRERMVNLLQLSKGHPWQRC